MNFSALVHELLTHHSTAMAWCLAALTLALAADTLIRLYTERHRLVKEELNDDDRAFAWRLVIFLVLPILVLIDLRVSEIVIAAGIRDGGTIALCGELVQLLFALVLLPALLVRPHPFLATFLGYSVAFTLGLNLVLNPALALAGVGTERLNNPFIIVHTLLTVAFLFCLRYSRVRLWFSGLTRPQISKELAQSITDWKERRHDANLTLRTGLLYVRAGMNRQAKRLLKHLQSHTLHATFLKALICFRQRRYAQAKVLFVQTSEFQGVDGELKATLLAAAACAAFADGEIINSLNLCDRALEFEDACLTARMVRVDVYLAQGKKAQAARDIMVAMHLGLNFDLKDKVPVDIEQTYMQIAALSNQAQEVRSEILLRN